MKKLKVTINGIAYQVEVEEIEEKAAVKVASPISEAVAAPVSVPQPTAAPAALAAGDMPVSAPMPGKVTKVLAREGQSVKQGEVLLLLEAMKMQNEICASAAGTIKSINITEGQNVKNGEIMVVITK